MDDRLTNAELRAAIRETEKTVGLTVGTNNTDAKVHLDTLRMVERNRATALLAAAGEKEDTADRVDCHGSLHEAERRLAQCMATVEATEARVRELEAVIRTGKADNERLRGRIGEERQRAIDAESNLAACERERDVDRVEIAALRRRLEPLTEDEARLAWDLWKPSFSDDKVLSV